MDLKPGEAAAQAIHAAIESYHRSDPEIQRRQLAEGHGHVVVLTSRNEAKLHAAYARAGDLGLPRALFTDGDRPGDGAIALGIGPVEGGVEREITKKFQLM